MAKLGLGASIGQAGPIGGFSYFVN